MKKTDKNIGFSKEAGLFTLKTAFMISAVDGKISDTEYQVFDSVARESLGCNSKTINIAISSSMQAGGFLLLLQQTATDEQVIKAFTDIVRGTVKNLVTEKNKFLFKDEREVRRAFAIWIHMAIADHTYSLIERKVIIALQKMVNSGKVPFVSRKIKITDQFLTTVEKLTKKAVRLARSVKGSTLDATISEKFDIAMRKICEFVDSF